MNGRYAVRTPLLLLLAVSLSAPGGSFELARDTLDIPVGQYRWIGFTVDIAQQEQSRVEGFLSLSPDSAGIELVLMHRDDFARWSAGLPDVDTLFYSRTGSGEVLIPIEGMGDMALVLSNRGNYHRTGVIASLDFAFAGDGVPYNPLLTGSRIVVAVLAGGVALALLLGIVVRESGRRRRRRRGVDGPEARA